MARKKGWIIVISLALGALLMIGCSGAAQGGDPAEGGTPEGFTPSPPPEDIPIMSFTETTPVHPILSSMLSDLYVNWQTDPDQAKATANMQGLKIEADRVEVVLILGDVSLIEPITEEIKALNGEVGLHYETTMEAWIPVHNLVKLANLSGIWFVREPNYGFIPDPVTPDP